MHFKTKINDVKVTWRFDSFKGHKFTSFCNYSVLPSLNKVNYNYY